MTIKAAAENYRESTKRLLMNEWIIVMTKKIRNQVKKCNKNIKMPSFRGTSYFDCVDISESTVFVIKMNICSSHKCLTFHFTCCTRYSVWLCIAQLLPSDRPVQRAEI